MDQHCQAEAKIQRFIQLHAEMAEVVFYVCIIGDGTWWKVVES